MRNEAWPCRQIGDLFQIDAGKTMSAAARGGAAMRPFLRTSNVLWDEINLDQVDVMSFSDEEFASKRVLPGDLLVCEGGEIGRAAIWAGEIDQVSFQNHLHRLRPRAKGIEPRFYVFFLQSAFTQLGLFEGAGNKTTIPNLSRNRLAVLEVPVPPLPEQRAIATALGTIREGVKAHAALMDTAQALKRAAMRELFTRGLRGEALKETEIGPVPESWEVVPLEQYTDAISKGSSPKWQGFDYVSEGILFVRSQNVGDGILELRDRVYLHPSWNAKERRSVLKTGDVLINLVGASIGRAALGDERIDGANCNQAVCFVRLTEGGFLGAFVTGFLMSTGGQDQMHGSKKDVARANLSLEDVRGFRVPKPTMDEQHEIVTILNAIDRKIELHKEKRAVLEALFKSLLQKLMIGEVRAADLNLDALGRRAEAA